MKVVAFIGSPRKHGNTNHLVSEILRGASEAGANTSTYYLNELNIKGCQACYACKKQGHCILNDDMKELYKEIESADIIVIGTPIYMFQVTGQTKIFTDRLFALINPDFSSRLKPGKKVIIAATQGNPDAKMYYNNIDSYGKLLKFMGFGDYQIILAAGTREKDDILKQKDVLEKAYQAIHQLVGA